MLISTGWWRRFYDEGDGGSAGGGTAASSESPPAGTTEGGDRDVGGDGGGSDDGGDGDSGGAGDDPGSAGGAGDGVQAGGAGGAAALADPSAGLLDYVRDKFGVDLGRKYQSGEAAIQGMLNAVRMVGQRSQEAELGRRFAGYETEFEQFLRHRQEQAAAQQTQQQQAAPEQAQQPWWNPPAYDESWSRWVVRDQDGNATLREDTPIEVRRGIEERRTYLERWQHQIATDPVKALEAPMEQFKRQVREEILSEIQQQQSWQQETQYASQFVNQNATWIYQHNQQGQVVFDFDSGKPVPTPAGAYFIQALMQLDQSGVRDQRQMVAMATQMTRGAMAAIQAQQQQVGTGAAPGTGGAPPSANATAAGTAPVPPAATQRRRQPTAGVLPGETKVSTGRGKSLREMLVASANDLPEREFSDAT